MSISWQKIVFFGVLIGIISFFCFDLVFVLLPILFLAYRYIYNRYDSTNERKFILSLLTVGLAVRIIGILLYYHIYLLGGNTDILGPDGESYLARGWYISRLLTGGDILSVPSPEQIFYDYSAMVEYYGRQIPDLKLYQVGIFSYFIGFIYACFSYVPLFIRAMNSALSVLTALIVYELGKDIFGDKTAKISMVLVIFLPSIFIFSLTNTKDPLINFSLVFSMLMLKKYIVNKRFFYLIVLICTLTAIYFLRIVIFLPFLAVLALIYLSRLRIFRKTIFIGLAALLIFLSGRADTLLNNLDIATITNPHIGYINTPGNNYKILPDEYYSGAKDIHSISSFELAIALIKGGFHYLFEPFPLGIKSKGELFGAIQGIAWAAFFPFVLLGIIYGLKYRFSSAYPVLIYIIIFSAMLAIGGGNVGTVFRHRDMVMPFFIIFGAAGICGLRGYIKPIA